nr:MAG TPA: hypothetical protein [Caudoviricetes sp.]
MQKILHKYTVSAAALLPESVVFYEKTPLT